jgi:hypothetical protein
MPNVPRSSGRVVNPATRAILGASPSDAPGQVIYAGLMFWFT